ncbi:PadR family transcriptional regulator [Cellulomonas gilvus]|uniref:Transcriptional regulator, PadR-like family n=1 Tax=Cellulomonas gilvus (strain ATCC 13127 / NRRL B-14078) TaxID=593907 RepID=F7ZZC9_CELGA|nr:PadR family transcriptional regulator [Cellulomonas gilvus]AEI13676.1 transcriptional regulator, PadR-like family [Cellulomonas gilvus ATCC 13127]
MRGRSDVLEPAILGLLHESPMHGYELRKRLNLVLGSFRALSYGSLYPCLKSLAERGWIVGTESVADPHAVGSKRARIVYQITADGKEHLQSVLATSGPAAWEDENFDVRFAFFSQTDAETRLRILEGRRTRLTERLETIRQSVARTRERMDEYTLELQRHGLDQAEREVRWLDGLIDNERGIRRARPAGTGPRTGAASIADGEHAAPARSTEKERG